MTLLIVGLAVAVVLVAWLTWTATRIDRLGARTDAAWASLDAQLVRRAAAVRDVADECAEALDAPQALALREAAGCALQADRTGREAAENVVSRELTRLDPRRVSTDQHGPETLGELDEACVRVQMARTFYNDAVRDSRTLRAQWLPRMTGLGRRRPPPDFFDIDDTPGLRLRVP